MKEFINELSSTLGIERRELIEKDIILHKILLDLSENKFFSDNFLFKGGTCLIKAYFGYYRFSEDIDFTWKNQEAWNKKSQKKIRRYLSGLIENVGGIFEDIAEKRGLDFILDKSNSKYLEFGGGGKTTTFKIWYRSEILDRESFFKVQINFVDLLCFPHKQRKLKSLLTEKIDENKKKELSFLFPDEYKEYSKKIDFSVYDEREILCEKIRAILTRKGIKMRDFVDIYLISRELDLEEIKKECLDKIKFALSLYEKYRENLKAKKDILKEDFTFEHEKHLLLAKLPEDFYRFLKDFRNYLECNFLALL